MGWKENRWSDVVLATQSARSDRDERKEEESRPRFDARLSPYWVDMAGITMRMVAAHDRCPFRKAKLPLCIIAS